MSAAELLLVVGKLNLAAAAAILIVLALRPLARPRVGARLTYALWLLPPIAMLATLAPARRVVVRAALAPAADAAFPVWTSLPASLPAGPLGPSVDPVLVMLALWIAGACVAALATARAQHRFLAEAMKGGVGPAVVGVISPRVITPSDFAERFDAEEQALVLAHEQVHIRRQDLRLNALASAIQCLFWFNPLIHLANRCMRVDQELACDEAVVSRFPHARNAYARALVKSQLALRPLPLGCYWPSRGEHPFLERIARLKAADVGAGHRFAGACALALLAAACGVAAWAATPAKTIYVTSGLAYAATVEIASTPRKPARAATRQKQAWAANPEPMATPPSASAAPPVTVEPIRYVGSAPWAPYFDPDKAPPADADRVDDIGSAPVPADELWTRYFDWQMPIAITGAVVDVRFRDGARAEVIVEHEAEGRKTRFRVAAYDLVYLTPNWRYDLQKMLGSSVSVRGFQAYDTSCDGGCLMVGMITGKSA